MDLPPEDALPALDAQRLVEGPRDRVVLAVVDDAAVGDVRLVLGDRQVVDGGPLSGLDATHRPPAVGPLHEREPRATRQPEAIARAPEGDAGYEPERPLREQREVERVSPVVGLGAPGLPGRRAEHPPEGHAGRFRCEAERPARDRPIHGDRVIRRLIEHVGRQDLAHERVAVEQLRVHPARLVGPAVEAARACPGVVTAARPERVLVGGPDVGQAVRADDERGGRHPRHHRGDRPPATQVREHDIPDPHILDGAVPAVRQHDRASREAREAAHQQVVVGDLDPSCLRGVHDPLEVLVDVRW